MQKIIDGIFTACGVLAAVFLLLIAVLVLAQIIGRLFGVLVPSADEFAGYCLAASSFLALGYALRHDSHIRVTLLLRGMSPKVRRASEIWCLAVGTAVSGYLTFYTLEMVWQSFIFGDMTQGLVPIPLWLPQTGMAIGVSMLTLALAIDLAAVLMGREPSYGTVDEMTKMMEAARHEGRDGGRSSL